MPGVTACTSFFATSRLVNSSSQPILYTSPSTPLCMIVSNALATSVTKMKCLELEPSPWMQTGSPLTSRLTNLGITFSGYWCGPKTLLPRVTMIGILNEYQYDRAMFSAAALVAAYGLVGSSTSPSLRLPPPRGGGAPPRPEREGAPLALRAVRLKELHRRDRDDPRLAHARRPLGEVDAGARRVHRGEGRLRVCVGEEQDRRAALWRRELEALDRRFSRRQRRGAVQDADAHALGQRALRIVEGRADRVAALDQPRLAREEDLLERRAVAGRE
mmetsp:Transcript_2872/g.9069  ORF Transcript_2872/g.9069 Transcript_2872/m.9069 type:complete len:274 (+) Transcript_2872:545-1366(+)